MQSPDLLDRIFNAGDDEQEDGQAGGGNPQRESGQAGAAPEGDDEHDEINPSPSPDGDEMVEVELTDGSKQKFPPAQAKIIQRQVKDYLELKSNTDRKFAELDRKLSETQKPPEATEPAYDYEADTAREDQEIQAILEGESIVGLTRKLDQRNLQLAQEVVQAELGKLRAQLAPLLSMMQEQGFERGATRELDAFEAEVGVKIADRAAVLAEAKRLAGGGMPTKDQFWRATATVAVKTGREQVTPDTTPASKPRVIPPGGGTQPLGGGSAMSNGDFPTILRRR